MKTLETRFEHELEIFRTEAEAGAQFFYAYLAVHAAAGDHKPIFEALNRAPLFWNTSLGALQLASFIALGRVFDQSSAHNIDRVLCVAQANLQIFSKKALGRRKQGNSPEPPEWVDEYLRDVYVPTARDFRRLRRYVQQRRKIYEAKYRGIRDRIFAHKEVSDPRDIEALFAKTSIRELQRLFAFLLSLHEALWQLFFNGRKPVLRPSRYSVSRMRALPSASVGNTAVQERIIHEAEEFLKLAAGTLQRPL
jgi:hypothetical protein